MYHETIKQRAQKLGLRGGDLAALAGISAPKLSNFFRGRAELDDLKRKELVQFLDDIEALKACFPIPLGCHDPKLLAVALVRFRAARFTSFARLTKAIDWSQTPEGLEQKFPKIFRSKASAK